MATLSVLSYNLPQGLIMKASSNGNTTNSNSNGSGSGSGSGNNSASNGSNSSNNLSKTFNKITVQNVLGESNGNSLNISNNNNIGGSSNNVNTIVRKIKDFGMFGAVNNAGGGNTTSITTSSGITVTARKRPLAEQKSKNENKPAVIVTKKVKLSKEPATPKSTKKSNENVVAHKLKTPTSNAAGITPAVVTSGALKPAGTPGRKGLPLPQAVARRNARERNRVKQVNNGFALLRERIPEEVAEAFESQGAGRGAAKKLSKVETLRMAVEYIRNLEHLLGFDFPIGGGAGVGGGRSMLHSPGGGDGDGDGADDDSFSIVKDEFDALSPGLDEPYEDSLSNYDVDEYFGGVQSQNNSLTQPSYVEQSMPQVAPNPLDTLPSITTLNGLQYIRIPGTNTYQLLTPDIFVGNSNSPPNSSIDDEQFNALIDANCPSPAASSATTTGDLHSSPPSIIGTTATTRTAPATQSTATTTAAAAASNSNGAFVNQATSSLSQSPVPLTSSPSGSSSLHHLQLQQQQSSLLQPAMLSPAANELLLQTCAAVERLSDNRRFVAPTPPQQQQQPHQQQQQQHLLLPRMMIKQEYNDTDFVSSTPSPTAVSTSSLSSSSSSLIYQIPAMHDQQQQQQQQLLLGHAPLSLSMSPPLDRCNAPTQEAPSSVDLQSFYEHDQNGSFYEGVVTFKKELNDVLLDSSATTAGLSDESMMEAIDWWEAHTPKSEGGSVML